MAQLTELDRISIAVICVYTPALFIAFLLAFRHGFGRSAGWLYLIIFSLARILGSALELAAINDPTNLSLLIGASTLQTIGLSPLVLVMLGLIGRVLESIRQTRTTVITPQHLRLIQILVIVGLILGVVGGVDLANSLGNVTDQLKSSGTYTLPTESIAGLALTVAGYGILVIATVVSSFQVTAAAPGEKRLLLAVALGLPFVLVRLIFACLGTFGSNRNFRVYGGSPDYPNCLLGMAIIMEMIAVAIFEGVGLSLQTIPRGTPKDGIPLRTMQPRDRAVEEGRA